MTTDPANRLIDQLIRYVLPGDGDRQADGDLLTRFVEHHDETALTALVRRHGMMVWGVCVRALRNHHDAEDAFQATFLVLVRKAATVVPREMVGNWLYGVAHQATLQARRVIARRRAREVQVTDMPDIPTAQPDVSPDVRFVLDEELVRLPAIYRAVVVLCDLEGRTRKEVAHHLGVPEGTVGGRLARARTMLGKRLVRRGVALSASMLGMALASQATASPVPAAVVSSAIKAVATFAAEQAATGAVSLAVAELVAGVTKAMFAKKLKVVTVVALLSAFALGGVGAGIGLLAGPGATRTRSSRAAEAPVNTPKGDARDEEAGTAWGKEINGLQAGLAFRPSDKWIYRHGEAVHLVLRVRNVGAKTVTFQHIGEFFHENPPAVTDLEGKPVPLPTGAANGRHLPGDTTVAPGKAVDLFEWEIGLQEVGERSKRPLTIHGTRTFTLRCARVVGPTSANPAHPAPALDQLATGNLKLEVQEAEAHAPVPTFLKQPEQARRNVAASPKFNPRVFVYRAEPTPGTIVGHNGADEIVLNVGVRDGVRFGHAFQIRPAGATTSIGIAKVMELDGNRAVAKVVSLNPGHALKSLKGFAAVASAPGPKKGRTDVERRLGKNVWQTESLENRIIRDLMQTTGGQSRLLIVQEEAELDVTQNRRPVPPRW